jgi:hypothetical protein
MVNFLILRRACKIQDIIFEHLYKTKQLYQRAQIVLICMIMLEAMFKWAKFCTNNKEKSSGFVYYKKKP